MIDARSQDGDTVMERCGGAMAVGKEGEKKWGYLSFFFRDTNHDGAGGPIR